MTLFAKWQIHQKVEILMDYDLMGLSGVAAIQWETISSHPVLTEERTRVALATFLYARTLVNHKETRIELFHRVGNAGEKLERGETEFLLEPWSIEKGGIAFPLWPWSLTSPVNLGKAKIYKANLESRPNRATRGNLKMALGQEAVLAPSAPLIALTDLSNQLNEDQRKFLGQSLLTVNEYYRTPEAAKQIGSDAAALNSVVGFLSNS